MLQLCGLYKPSTSVSWLRLTGCSWTGRWCRGTARSGRWWRAELCPGPSSDSAATGRTTAASCSTPSDGRDCPSAVSAPSSTPPSGTHYTRLHNGKKQVVSGARFVQTGVIDQKELLSSPPLSTVCSRTPSWASGHLWQTKAFWKQPCSRICSPTGPLCSFSPSCGLSSFCLSARTALTKTNRKHLNAFLVYETWSFWRFSMFKPTGCRSYTILRYTSQLYPKSSIQIIILCINCPVSLFQSCDS